MQTLLFSSSSRKAGMYVCLCIVAVSNSWIFSAGVCSLSRKVNKYTVVSTVLRCILTMTMFELSKCGRIPRVLPSKVYHSQYHLRSYFIHLLKLTGVHVGFYVGTCANDYLNER